MSIWDIRSMSSPLGTTMIDTGSGLITPFYDPDTSVMFLSGKVKKTMCICWIYSVFL